jgi:hypothetical protein
MMALSTRRPEEQAFASRDHGQSVSRDVLALVSTIISSAKHMSAQKIFAVAHSSRAFGEEGNGLPHFQAYGEAVADGLEDLADYIDRTEVPEIFNDIGALAKRQPILTAAVTLAAGIAVMQVARNSQKTERAAGRGSRSLRRPRRKTNGQGKR